MLQTGGMTTAAALAPSRPSVPPHRKQRNQFSALPFALTLEARIAMGEILLARGVPYREIRRQTGLGEATIARIKRGERKVLPDVAEALKRVEESKLTLAAHQFVDHATRPDIVAKMSGLQAMTAGAIALDKRELLAGRATSIVQYHDLSESAHQVLARLAALEQEELTLTRGANGVFAVPGSPATLTPTAATERQQNPPVPRGAFQPAGRTR